jgi:DNA-binding NarL/FixJ family response regulator
MSKISVLLVDDHLVVRQGIRSLLSQSPDIQVVGEAENSQVALGLVSELKPDVILLDVRLADSNGLDFARQLQRYEFDSRVIILTSYDNEEYLLQAAQAGVYGYLLKNTSAEILTDAVRAVYAGERRLSPALAGVAFRQVGTLSQTHLLVESGLIQQELEILRLIAQGTSTQEMAQTLYLSERTIKRKVQDVLDKLGATNRAQAVSEAYKRGLL